MRVGNDGGFVHLLPLILLHHCILYFISNECALNSLIRSCDVVVSFFLHFSVHSFWESGGLRLRLNCVRFPFSLLTFRNNYFSARVWLLSQRVVFGR